MKRSLLKTILPDNTNVCDLPFVLGSLLTVGGMSSIMEKWVKRNATH